MVRIFKIDSILFMMLIVTCCSVSVQVGGQGLSQEEHFVRGNADIHLPANAEKLEQDALSGSGEAAYELGDRYFAYNGLSQEGFYWMTVAEQNGSKRAMLALGAHLQLSDSLNDKIRARYWFNRVVAEGDKEDAPLAEDYLKYLNRELDKSNSNK